MTYVKMYQFGINVLQVSHHPPVSAVYVTNRQEGFSVTATVLAKSKFYGRLDDYYYCFIDIVFEYNVLIA